MCLHSVKTGLIFILAFPASSLFNMKTPVQWSVGHICRCYHPQFCILPEVGTCHLPYWPWLCGIVVLYNTKYCTFDNFTAYRIQQVIVPSAVFLKMLEDNFPMANRNLGVTWLAITKKLQDRHSGHHLRYSIYPDFSEKAERPLPSDYTISSDVSHFCSVSHKIHSEYLLHRQPCQLVLLKMNDLGV